MQRKEREKAGVWGDHYGILTGGGESGQTLPVEGRRLESVSQPVCRPSRSSSRAGTPAVHHKLVSGSTKETLTRHSPATTLAHFAELMSGFGRENTSLAYCSAGARVVVVRIRRRLP